MAASDHPARREAELIEQLRDCSQRYFQAVDAWETAHQKYYRLPTAGAPSPDLEPFHQEYLATRQRLQQCLPDAHRLCLKYNVRNPWNAILHIKLGSTAPQNGSASAIGRAERALVVQCLD